MFKFGIIGCGIIAPFHARAIQSVGNSKLVAVCDIIEAKAEAFARQFGVENIYTDYRQMLMDADIDIVCICTPSGLHGEMAIAAARAGKHILCEKPMEITKEKLDAVIDEVQKSKVKMACVFQRRMQPLPIKVKRALDSGVFGRILVADAYLKYHRTKEYYKSADWRATWALDGGGALMNQGIHGVDLINWFAGGIESVYGITRTQLHAIEVEDSAVCSVKYKSGAIGVIECTTCVLPAQDSRFEIHCENGSIIFSDTGLIQWHLAGGENSATASGEDGFSAKDDPTAIGLLSHLPIVKDLMDAITYDRAPAVPPEEGRVAADIILSIYNSSKENREIRICEK